MDKKYLKSNEFANIVEEMYLQMNTGSSIAKKLGCNEGAVYRVLNERNVKMRTTYDYKNKSFTTRKNHFNIDFFESINNEEKAYWLGFLYADGYVQIRKSKTGGTKGGSVEVGLKKEDDYHLFNFLQCIDYKNPKVKYRSIKLKGKEYESARIIVSSIKMAKDLHTHGCTQAKSLTLKFPNNIKEELMPHFVRGYFDGDGHIGLYLNDKYETVSCTVLGTEEFLEGLKAYLLKNQVKTNKIVKEKSSAFKLAISDRQQVVNFYNLVYADATIFLDRKIDGFRETLIYLNKDFKIGELQRIVHLLDEDLQEKMKIRHSRPNIQNKFDLGFFN